MSAPTRRPTPNGVLILPASAERADWLEARRWREGVGYCIGASDSAAILDLPDCGTRRELYHDKVNGTSRPETEAMRWGRLHEDTIAREWTHRRQTVVRAVGLISSATTPWLQCTLDRRVAECPDNPTEVRSRCALEVKTRGAWRNARWHAEVPDDILAQVMIQMAVTGYRHIHVAVLVGGNELHEATVWWDDELAEYILGELAAFRADHLEAGVEPAWSVAKADKEIKLDKLMHPDRVGEISVIDIGEVIEYAQLAADAGAASRAKDEAKARLHELAQGRRTVLFAGHLAYWWREGVHTSADLEVLARYPAAYAAAVRSQPTWTLQIAKEYKPAAGRRSGAEND